METIKPKYVKPDMLEFGVDAILNADPYPSKMDEPPADPNESDETGGTGSEGFDEMWKDLLGVGKSQKRNTIRGTSSINDSRSLTSKRLTGDSPF